MAIEIQNLDSIILGCKQLSEKKKLLILGNANLFFMSEDFRKKADRLKYPTLSPESSELDCNSFGKLLGFDSTETLDLNGKADIVFNLHDVLPAQLVAQYDCIIDAGVLYWCFDPATAIKNIYQMAKKNAVIIHSTAITGFFGRGYYNIHPRMFFDFYAQNQSRFIVFSTHTRPLQNNRIIRLIKRTLRVFTGEKPDGWVTTVNHSNFVNDSTSAQLSFSNSISIPEPTLISNNTTGTLVFQKTESADAKIPVQLT